MQAIFLRLKFIDWLERVQNEFLTRFSGHLRKSLVDRNVKAAFFVTVFPIYTSSCRLSDPGT